MPSLKISSFLCFNVEGFTVTPSSFSPDLAFARLVCGMWLAVSTRFFNLTLDLVLPANAAFFSVRAFRPDAAHALRTIHRVSMTHLVLAPHRFFNTIVIF